MTLIWCNVITVICLVVTVFYVVFEAVRIKRSSRTAQITYLRNFKKGRFTVILLLVLPLLLISHLHVGEDFFRALFLSIKQLVNIAVLKFDYDAVDVLYEQSLLFQITLTVSYFFVCFNTTLFVVSIFSQRLSAYFNNLKLSLTTKKRLYIFGEKQENEAIYLSEKSVYKSIIGNFSDAKRFELYKNKINYLHNVKDEDVVKNIIKSLNRGEVSVIINCVTQEENLHLCNLFKKELKKIKEKEILQKINVFVFGDPLYEEIYCDVVMQSLGCIHYINREMEIAIDFVSKYPISKFLTKEQVDYSTSLVDPKVDINFLFIGFSESNKQIFLTSVANNQFLTKGENGLELKPVNYYVFDKEEAEFSKNFNHNLNRYQSVKDQLNPSDYLPLPDLPANKEFFPIEVNNPKLYKKVKEILTKNSNSVNLIVIDFGSDLENIDMAKRLSVKRKEWQVENCTLFVKSKKETFCKEDLEKDNCYFIGNDEGVFNVDNIVGDKLTKMALLRNEVYDIEYLVKNSNAMLTEKEISEVKEASNHKWYFTKTQFERESSIYCVLSLRSKLNLLGLEICDQSSEKVGLTEDEYFKIYAKNDMPDFKFYNCEIEGKKVIKYSLDYKDSTRTNLAVLEHYRWNSFMISKGFIPASINQILTEKTVVDGKEKFTNGKNYALRRHGNLTTFNGLKEYASLLSKRSNLPLEATDVISYDYQILDDAFWILNKVGLKIVKK